MTLRWANTTRIVQLTDDPWQEPSDHDAALSLVMSSIEIGIRRATNLSFITHLDILRHASAEAQNAQSPLSIPLPRLEHTFADGKTVTLEDVHVKPDALFGVRLRRRSKFFAVEFDRSTEDVEPTKNLVRASWLRKILSYSASAAKPKPDLRDLSESPQSSCSVHLLRCDAHGACHAAPKAHATYPSQFRFKTIAPVDPLLNAATLPQLVTEPWQRIGGTFNLLTAEEGR